MVKLVPRLVLVVACFLAFIYVLETQMLAPVLPIYARDIGALPFMVGIIMGVYSLSNSLGNVVFGRVSDGLGRRLPLTIGFIGAAALVLMYALATSPTHLVVLRTIHGFFAGALGPCTAAVFSDLAPAERKGAYMGLWSTSVAAGVTVASALAGYISTTYGYTSVWFTIAAAHILGVIILWSLLPETRRRATRRDSGPTAIAADAPPRPQFSSLFKRRNVLIACYAIFAVYWVLGTAVALLSLYLADLRAEGVIGADPKLALGMLFAVFGLAAILLTYLCGNLSDVVGRKTPIAVAFLLLTAATPLVSNPSVPLIVFAWVAAFAIPVSAIWPASLGLLADELAPHERGIGFGLFMVCLTLGTGIGMPVMGYLGGQMGLATAIKLAAIVPAAGFALCLTIQKRPPAAARLRRSHKAGIAGACALLLLAAYPLILLLRP